MSPGDIGPESPYEKQHLIPISDHKDHRVTKSADHGHRGEFVVKIDGNNECNNKNNINVLHSKDAKQVAEPIESKSWKESSYDFRKEDGTVCRDGDSSSFFRQRLGIVEDPPSRLIEQFLYKKKASGEIALDMDLEMDELQIRSDRLSMKPNCQVSDDDSSDEEQQDKTQIPPPGSCGSSNLNVHEGGGGGRSGVVRCTSNAGFRPASAGVLLRTRTRSRLIDPLDEQLERRSSRNTPKSSGKLNLGMIVDEEEDDLSLEDIPEELRKAKLSVLTLFEWASIILIISSFVASLTVPRLEKKLVWNLHLWKWAIIMLVLLCGRLVSGWTIRIVIFFIERNFMLRKRVLYFVYGVKKGFQNCIWLALVLIVWYAMLYKKVEQESNAKIISYVTKILVCLLVSTSIWLAKSLLVKILASTFHVRAYFERIQDSLFNQYVIEILSEAPSIATQQTREGNESCMAEIRELQNAGATLPDDLRETAVWASIKGAGKAIGPRRSPRIGKQQDEGITIDELHKLNQKNISAWNMKRMMNIIRRGVTSTIDEHKLDKNHHQYDTEVSNIQIKSEFEAKVAAKKIFRNVAKLHRYIYLEDLMRFMGKDEAVKTMNLFEGAKLENKRISKFAFKNWVVNAFRERRALALTLNDTKTAVKKLHHMLNIIVGIIITITGLLILGIATTHLLVFVSSQLLLVVIIFGNTCKTTFEAIIFLFAIHPFDVGDRCEVGGVQLIVEEMNILSTVFLRDDNLKITYPNSVLAILPISNYYRSPDMGDAIDFCINVSTPLEKIAIMKQRIIRYTEMKENYWCPGAMVVLRDVEDMNKLKISVWLSHRMNFQDMGERFVRRERLIEEIMKVLKELDIEYRMLPVDVNVRNMPALASTRLPSNWTG
ncbi:mechanosensitive ion channel protein 6-like [Macadamia integrifolia]|uniref:mechanosensitive ion channel protein 6-like n=1 Tax=Macadamia integrifolia TaxID=60698 RepID=UPI001C4EFF0A|nr:mechanosensitive ion channel protein 6-like [Macadamia integrifolia]